MTLVYVSHAAIDRLAYDRCVQRACNYRPYSLAWSLDALCGTNWDLLVFGDYQAVMPLPYNRKWFGFKRIIQPLHLQQLGIFYQNQAKNGGNESDNGQNEVENNAFLQKVVPLFLTELKKRYWFFNVHFSFDALSFLAENVEKKGFSIQKRANFVLAIHIPYLELAKNYNAGMRYSMRKVAKKTFDLRKNIPFAAWETLFLRYQAPKFTHFPTTFMAQAKKLIERAVAFDKGVLYGVYDANNELLCAAFYLLDNQRITYLFSAASEQGRKDRAMHFLMDRVVACYAEQAEILDFEGSSIPSIAEFYSGFGAKNQPYFSLNYRIFMKSSTY